jgi:CHAD domain-containing protein
MLVIAAIGAGATAGATSVASAAVEDAYKHLRTALRRRLQSRAAALEMVDQYADLPADQQVELQRILQAVGVDRDREVLDAAALVLQEYDPAGTRAGRYRTDLRYAQGIQVGDRNQQTNYFGPRQG